MSAKSSKSATLVLEDGTQFKGISFGAERSVSGEFVFHTGMVGYTESITDPSYCGQILVFSFPLVGNYGVPPDTTDANGIPLFFESAATHISGIVVSEECELPSHWNSTRTLSQWLKEKNVPAVSGIDTRALIKIIREKGSLSGKIILEGDDAATVPQQDISKRNLVAEVSTREIRTLKPENPNGKRVVVVDCGAKANQYRCLLQRGFELKVVPWDYDFTKEECDGIFISNGPGDPAHCSVTVQHIKKAMEQVPPKPMFGVCMGNQLMGLAAGAVTHKMKYGNRGLNQPCVDLTTKRCHITSQNHGYVIDSASLTGEWEPMFVNANDESNEGIRHKTKPFFSVQFHPEAKAGPAETEYLFDIFAGMVTNTKTQSPLAKEITFTKPSIRKVLILGSGGLSIGQAGEFDYSGSQAIKALKEEGITTILINPNVATVQTSAGLADKVYFLPVTPEYVTKLIENERPDGILVTFGGQTALNCGIELYKQGILASHGVAVLGTPIESIIATEDRGIFAEKLGEINEKIAPSVACRTMEEACIYADKIGYPLIVRAAFCLGGLGSGFADNREQLVSLVTEALASSEQVLVERSLRGWKEIEYEVVRDAADNCITVCNMENMDPMGIHTGESIVVAPSQTLTDAEYQMLRNVAIKTVRHLGVVGECNIQYALNPNSQEYCIIEVNARLSRSSALASKATGYPLAFIAAKLALGHTLPILRNTVTKKTTACFEPSLDYVVVKMPRWDLQKFGRVSTKISSAMKSVGEVMAIGRKFEEAIQKAVRTVMESSVDGFQPGIVKTSDEELEQPTDKRIFVIASALRDGYTVDRIHELTKIDKWFLNKLKNISDMETQLAQYSTAAAPPSDVLLYAKQIGFSDKQIARCLGSTETAVREMRKERSITPVVKHIDTVAGEFPAKNNYLYVTYNGTQSDVEINEKAFMVLGSGAYRIGSSVEFDWCAVGCIRTMRSLGHKSIMVNFNPETVSTDYDECDYLFFEELSLERVLDIYELHQSAGVVVSVGGQIPNNLSVPLSRYNVKIIGTHPDMIDNAENRYKFSRLLDTIGVDQPQWKELSNVEDTHVFCESVGYPCLVRPSYVLSGAAMNVVHSVADLTGYLTEAAAVSREHPVVISKFIEEAKEIEVDAVADAGEVVLYAVSEHVENAGVHSGDATIVCPAQDLGEETIQKVITTTRKIASALVVTGPFNIQFIAKNNEIKVIECNLRASRSFPFVSKTLNIDFISLATKIMMGVPYKIPDVPELSYVGVKVPQFSFIRLKGADPVLGVEMASTGEVACFGATTKEAYIKGLLATGFKMPQKNILLSIGSFKEKHEFLPFAKKLVELGFTLYGTSGTADFMSENKVPIQVLDWHIDVENPDSEVNKKLKGQMIDLFINLPSKNKYRRPASFMSRGYLTRRIAIDFSVPLITNVKCAKLFVESIYYMRTKREIGQYDIRSTRTTRVLPGLIDVHVHLRDPGATHKEDWDSGTCAALAGGFTVVGAMPNTNPPITDAESFALASQLASSKARCDYGIFLGASATNFAVTPSIAPQAFALKMYLEDTFGPLIMNDNLTLWKKHVMNWPGNHPLCVHATGRNLSAILMLAMLYDKHIHVCHVSFREDIELIKDAKERGMKVSCETTPHHLFLTASELEHSCCEEGFRMVKPHVGTEDDREALWSNLDVIDMIATDHAPHTVEEKTGPKPPPGFPGLETSLPLMLTAVHDGKLTMERLIELMHTNPRRIFNIPEQPDTWIEVELGEEWVIPEKMPFSRCGWTVFKGMKVRGSVRRVVLRGELAFLDGKVLAPKGFGQDVRKMPVGVPAEAVADTTTRVSEPSTLHPLAHQVAKKPETSKLVSATPKKKRPQSPPLPSTEGVPVGSFQGRHVLSVSQFGRKDLHYLFSVAHEMRVMVKRTGSIDLLKGKLLASLFYEPSTRTTSSFTAAMERLGGSVLNFNISSSSVSKGESLGDTVRTLESYADLVVMRHPEAGSAETVSKILKKPLINAGDGVGEHPTQALLDVFTIREELGTVNGLTITLLGDLKHGRTVHSLVQLLSMYQVKLHYVSPPNLRMPRDIIAAIDALGIEQHEHTDLDAILPQTNVLYVTRVQKERFESPEEYDRVKDSFVITPHTLTKAMEGMIVMHPLPRVNEISVEVDSDPRAAYFRQMENGMYVRMALLAMVLGKA